MTLTEEIRGLDIDDTTKKRLLEKVTELIEEKNTNGFLLSHCRQENAMLESVIISQSKYIGSFEEVLDIRNRFR